MKNKTARRIWELLNNIELETLISKNEWNKLKEVDFDTILKSIEKAKRDLEQIHAADN